MNERMISGNDYLRIAKHEQEMGRYWAAMARKARDSGKLERAAGYQHISALHYRDARVFLSYYYE
jgi:hypothetical protein